MKQVKITAIRKVQHNDLMKKFYRNGKKILILAGKAMPKVIREDKLNELI